MAKASTISAGAASILGAVMYHYSSLIGDEAIKQSVTLLIPSATLFIAWLGRILGGMGQLKTLNMALAWKAERTLRHIRVALNDEFLDDAKKMELRKDYEEAFDASLSIKLEDTKALKKLAENARNDLSKNISKGYESTNDVQTKP